MKIEDIFEKITGTKNALEWAECFVKKKGIYFDNIKIWWCWDAVIFAHKQLDKTDLFVTIQEEYKIPLIINPRFEKAAIDALQIMGRKNKPKELSVEWVQFKDTVVNVLTGETIKANKDLLLTNPIPWAIGESEDTPTIDKMFGAWVGNDNIQILHEINAYALLRDYFIRRVFCLFGEGSNGKTTFLEFMSIFFGEKNMTTTDLEVLLSSRFESIKLYRKLVCVVGETNFKVLERTGLLKQLTGNDKLRFEQKFHNSFDGKSYAKLVIASNSLPVTMDKTHGFYNRWLIIDFPNKFKEKRNILAEIPQKEYENLCKKYIRIAKQLIQTSGFTKEPSFEERKKTYEAKSNPLPDFVNEYYVKDPNGEVLLQDLFNKYVEYIGHQKMRKPTKNEFTRILRDEGHEISRKNVTCDDGEKTTANIVRGLKVKGEALPKITWNNI